MSTSIANAMHEATVSNKDGRHGMDNIENQAQVDKVHHNAAVQAAINEEIGNEPADTGPVLEQRGFTFDFDDKKKVLPDSFKNNLKEIAPALSNILPEFVDRTFWSTWTDLFRVANLIELEFGVLPNYDEAGRAWQAAQSPETFAFDKDTAGFTESTETEGVLQPMSWQEIAAKRAEGLKPMSNGQYQFYIESSERVLNGMAMLHALRDLGYQSQHTSEDVWQAARESEQKRQKAYAERQELEQLRKKGASEKALKEATENGSLIV